MTDEECAALAKTKERARRAVSNAIKYGRLIKPETCSRCLQVPRRGSDGRSLLHGHHHHGYDSPLDVEWLCVTCHCQDDPRPVGERNGHAKLTDDIVRRILTDRRGKRTVARAFSTSLANVKRIRWGLAWKHIPRDGSAQA